MILKSAKYGGKLVLARSGIFISDVKKLPFFFGKNISGCGFVDALYFLSVFILVNSIILARAGRNSALLVFNTISVLEALALWRVENFAQWVGKLAQGILACGGNGGLDWVVAGAGHLESAQVLRSPFEGKTDFAQSRRLYEIARPNVEFRLGNVGISSYFLYYDIYAAAEPERNS